jgi:hypothetical protein
LVRRQPAVILAVGGDRPAAAARAADAKIDKTYRRNPNPRPKWREASCVEGNANIVIGKENYWLSGDGFLMPAKKDQPPPDLRYFKQPPK